MPTRRHAFLCCLLLPFVAAGEHRPRNVILVTADGLRWQEVFGGMDPLLENEKSAGMQEADQLRAQLGASTREERRRKLMPFFWTTLARAGVVLGDVSKGSSVKVTNKFHVSYPGYSEILTGRAQDDVIVGNRPLQNPTETLPEFLRGKLGLRKEQAALFGSWRVFRSIGESKPGTIFINAGYEEMQGGSRQRELSALQFDMLTPWPTVRHDYITFEMALEYLRTAHPRFLHIAFGEPDDWAHDKRYDRVLESIGYFDRALKRLWTAIQSAREYRDSTVLVITSDHGRGSTVRDWTSHGQSVAGSEQIWLTIVSPETPSVGETGFGSEAHQRDIAPTILELLGISHEEYKGALGKPIPEAFKSRPGAQ